MAAVSDEQLQSADAAYMARHQLDALLSDLLAALLKQKPRDPLQYVIDALSLGPELAQQDPKTGLPLHRQEKLLQVFKVIDKDGSGRLSLRMLQEYANRYGGETLSLADLRGLFEDFNPADALFINQGEFLAFFARVSATITNRAFAEMIADMAR